MFSFLRRPIVSLHKTSICRQEPRELILCFLHVLFWVSKCGSHWLSPTNTVSASLLFYWRPRVTYISANVYFWMNSPFSGTAISDLQTARACRCRLSVCRGWARANRSRSPHSRTERWADSEALLEQTQQHRLSHTLVVRCYVDSR